MKNKHFNTTHGQSNSPEYHSWIAMRRRCGDPMNHNFHYYGGRGIKVCERWKLFENFLADMGKRPVGTSLSRIDNDGDYEPSNCQWATAKTQARNRRNNRIINYLGKTQTLAEWCEELSLDYNMVLRRVQAGWTTNRLFSQPLENHPWWKCDHCGRFIPFADFDSGKALRCLVTPDSDFTAESFKTLCAIHRTTE